MELVECLHNRRSIRKFQSKPVEKKQVREILQAGRWAPSGGNYQRWKFIIVSNEAKIKAMRQAVINCTAKKLKNSRARVSTAMRGIRCGTFFNAPLIIAVAVDLTEPLSKKKLSDLDKLTDSTEIISAGAAIQNMLLRIHDLGLGACWCRVDYYKREALQKCLNIKKPYYLISNLAVGYPAEKPKSWRKNLKKITEFIN